MVAHACEQIMMHLWARLWTVVPNGPPEQGKALTVRAWVFEGFVVGQDVAA